MSLDLKPILRRVAEDDLYRIVEAENDILNLTIGGMVVDNDCPLYPYPTCRCEECPDGYTRKSGCKITTPATIRDLAERPDKVRYVGKEK